MKCPGRQSILVFLLGLACAGCAGSEATNQEGFDTTIVRVSGTEVDTAAERAEMVDDQIVPRGISDQMVLEAMRSIPRHLFVPEPFADRAYQDRAIPIGHGQLISQPYIVALMSSKLAVNAGDRVLEIGTGSGYQSAVLAELGTELFTVEIIPDLSEDAAELLAGLGYPDISFRVGDGYDGWADHAPYDAIIVTAAPDHVPNPLVEQLAPGGRLVIPIGPPGAIQGLWLYQRGVDGEMTSELITTVEFVPLVRS